MKNFKTINKNGMCCKAQTTVTTPIFVNSIAVYEKDGKTWFELPGYRHKNDKDEWTTSYYVVPANKEAYAEVAKAVNDAIAAGKVNKPKTQTHPNLVGYVSVKVSNMTISVSYADDGRVIVPSYKDKNDKWWNYIGITKAQADAIKAEFDAELAKGGATAADVDDDGAAVVE